MTTQTPSQPKLAIPSGEWYIDPAKSSVHFHTRAMLGLFPVLGRFERFSGGLQVDESGRVSGELHVDAASIATGIRKRDHHLRSDDFFGTDQHPELTFTLTGLEPAGSSAADGRAHSVSGTLQIRDRGLPIHAQATIAAAGTEVQIEARLPIDHASAGLGWAKPGMIRKIVDADVKLTLTREQPSH